MKKRIWLAIGVLVVVAALVEFIVTKIHANQDAAALAEQLRLARAEGLPTTGQEFAASIQTAAPAENAGPLYKGLQAMFRTAEETPTGKLDPVQLQLDVLFHPSPKSLTRARTFLADRKKILDAVDRATALPKCWFDRDWSIGPAAVPFTEFAFMKGAAKLLALRASLAAAENRPADALADFARLRVLARHAACEPTIISIMVGRAIDAIALQALAECALACPSERRGFDDALSSQVGSLAAPNLKDEHREDLVDMLSLIDLCATPEGRKKVGIREEDIGAAARIFPMLLSQPKARIEIVKEERVIWDALDLPPKQASPIIRGATQRRDMALLAFPVAAQIYDMLGSGEEPTPLDRLNAWQAEKERYTAVAKALSGPAIPRSIRTSDLSSPYDGKALSYRFDGRQIVVTVSGLENALKIPPDKAFAKPREGAGR
ncbi:MAG TPA: hypothetical protein VMI31_00810 [Fimbriimonadaceae bacterium]|nr:hypothetical protein [Fimbriimonadaceae bacterium]